MCNNARPFSEGLPFSMLFHPVGKQSYNSSWKSTFVFYRIDQSAVE